MKFTKYILASVASIALGCSMTSCEVFGLERQEPYEYDYEVGIPSNKLGMSTYDFIVSRSDIFSILAEAIDYAEMEDYFRMADCTYILPTNTAFNSETATDLSYFQTHQLSDGEIDEATGELITYAPSTMKSYPKEQVMEFLLYHIVKGQYTHTNLPASPTWYETYATADTALVNMYIYKDREPNTTFNNFDGHYKASIKPRTGNLYSSDGSYIHVIDSWLDRPTKQQLNLK